MWSPPQRRYRFTKADRIRATREFRAVIRGGEKVSSKNLSLFIRRHPGPGRRLGLAIAGRLGGAVSRNRIKRRLREYIRLHRDRMAQGLDLVIVATEQTGPLVHYGKRQGRAATSDNFYSMSVP